MIRVPVGVAAVVTGVRHVLCRLGAASAPGVECAASLQPTALAVGVGRPAGCGVCVVRQMRPQFVCEQLG